MSTNREKTPWSADLKAENDGPDEAQREAVVAIDNVMGAHVLEVNALLFKELQSFVHVLQTVNSHTAFCGLWLWKTPIIQSILFQDLMQNLVLKIVIDKLYSTNSAFLPVSLSVRCVQNNRLIISNPSIFTLHCLTRPRLVNSQVNYHSDQFGMKHM